MKIIFIILTLCFCTNTFAQKIVDKDDKLPLPIILKYQNIEDLSPNTINLNPNLNNQIITIGEIDALPQNVLNVYSKNMNFVFSEKSEIKQELKNIMHKYPGDGNNLQLDAKGYKH